MDICTLKVVHERRVMGFRDDVKINQMCWFIWYQGCSEIYSYNLREKFKRIRIFTSETDAVDNIDYCRQFMVRFKAVYQTQVTGERNGWTKKSLKSDHWKISEKVPRKGTISIGTSVFHTIDLVKIRGRWPLTGSVKFYQFHCRLRKLDWTSGVKQ